MTGTEIPKDLIEHEGIVQDVKEDNTVMVKITSKSACSGCHAKSVCGVADTKDKIIKADTGGKSFKTGDIVTLVLDRKMGFAALFLGYFMPFLMVLFVLIAAVNLTGDEALAGIVSLVSLIPYYLTLYLLRGRIERKFTFRIK